VALTPDGAVLASGAADGSMAVADMETGKVRSDLAYRVSDAGQAELGGKLPGGVRHSV